MASTASTGATTAVSAGPQNQSIRQKFEDFGTFLYNSEEGRVLGRTGKSWAQIGLFYVIFYSCLAGFFAAMIAVFYQTLDWNEPKLYGPDSLLKQNPGLGFRPLPNVKTTIVRFVKGDPTTYSPYTDHIEAYLQYYENENQVTDTGVIVDCDPITTRRPRDQWDKACRFDLTSNLGADCIKQQAFGFDDGLPCILLKLNKVFDWQPQSYENNSVPDAIKGQYDPYHVKVLCEGENPADKDNIGPITYYPEHGFHYKYFPFRNQQGYRSPLVFVRFERPEPAVLIMVQCTAWAKNIEHNKIEKMGMVHFELLVD